LSTIGVFDSGVGGLSVLRTLRIEMPQARLVYLADNAFAPYGERTPAWVAGRSAAIAQHLRQAHAIDTLVVACNTATALAIDTLRVAHPDLPIVGVEPALKPAAALTRSGQVGVLATRGTLGSARYARLREQQLQASTTPLQIHDQPCDGLADAIERDDRATIDALCAGYVRAVRARAADLDVLVLGCTHYPFAVDAIRRAAGDHVQLLDPAEPVARRVRAVAPALPGAAGLHLLATGDTAPLQRMARRWLETDAPVEAVTVGPGDGEPESLATVSAP